MAMLKCHITNQSGCFALEYRAVKGEGVRWRTRGQTGLFHWQLDCTVLIKRDYSSTNHACGLCNETMTVTDNANESLIWNRL